MDWGLGAGIKDKLKMANTSFCFAQTLGIKLGADFGEELEDIQAWRTNCLLTEVQHTCSEGCSQGIESPCVVEVRASLTTQITEGLHLSWGLK